MNYYETIGVGTYGLFPDGEGLNRLRIPTVCWTDTHVGTTRLVD